MKRLAPYCAPNDKRWVMALLGLTTAVEFFENSLFVFSSSHIQGGIDAGPQEFVLAVAAYACTSMLVIMKQAWLAHRLGYRNFLGAALALFALGALLSGFCNTPDQLILCRAIQGLGGGALFTSSRILINLMFNPKERGTAVRYFMIAIFSVSALAPALAGTWIENYSWRWVFWGVVPVAAVASLGCFLWLPVVVPKQQHGGDFTPIPLVIFGVGVISVQLALSEARFDFFAYPLHFALFVLVGVGALSWFTWHQYRHPSPVFVLRGLNNQVYLTGLGLYFIHYFLANFSNYLFPIYAERAQGVPVETAGWLNTFSSVVSFLVILGYLRWASRFKQKKPLMLTGVFALAACSLVFSFMPPGMPLSAFFLPLIAKGLFGVLLVIPVAGLTYRELKAEQFAHGYRNKNLLRQWSGSLAQAVAAIMMQNRQAAVYDYYAGFANEFNPAFNHMIATLKAVFMHEGMPADEATRAALAQVAGVVDHQVLLIACNDLYRVLALLALVSAAIIFAQKKLQ
ncbi:MFS transporter [Silvimonas iriomotensis]|uniref:EmrB/QacA family drug resistance transporter n=1 Tax=Silvimonas iriomotensis TaxID=449662 RepID=A0ABQ2PFC0_9NEIS|nr:MFS transporter [Silvimonas iriomotensis]GGP24018.1 EmrB/QacA family drug resistance transporter [Silvimonas iriomotensis]